MQRFLSVLAFTLLLFEELRRGLARVSPPVYVVLAFVTAIALTAVKTWAKTNCG